MIIINDNSEVVVDDDVDDDNERGVERMRWEIVKSHPQFNVESDIEIFLLC